MDYQLPRLMTLEGKASQNLQQTQHGEKLMDLPPWHGPWLDRPHMEICRQVFPKRKRSVSGTVSSTANRMVNLRYLSEVQFVFGWLVHFTIDGKRLQN